jgi:hypothetical protein
MQHPRDINGGLDLGARPAASLRRLANSAVVTEDGPHPAVKLGAVAPGRSIVGLAGRATRVP